jgi:UDP-N-acetylmuramoyl-L-alanyl-D-glutamate--2,6-diaminopimelate ligase
MEVSSHALALHRIDGTSFAVAVFTNLSQDHLDFHSDIEDYFTAKAHLFTPEFTRVAVVDIDDAYGSRLAKTTTVSVVTVSPAGDPSADWWATDVVSDTKGSTFLLHGPQGRSVPASVSLTGSFNVRNALLAIVALVQIGLDLPVAVAGVATCTAVPGRMERVDVGQQFLAVVDYAHTPDAVTTLLAAVRSLVDGRVIVVLGCGGDRDRGKRPLMGAAAAQGADVAILSNDNPRSEDPAAILAMVRAGALSVPEADRAEVIVEPDRRTAIRRAVDAAGPGDAVVVAGKGHERTQETAGTFVPFDDAGELRAAIAVTAGSR